jgi:hypothetical protein
MRDYGAVPCTSCTGDVQSARTPEFPDSTGFRGKI